MLFIFIALISAAVLSGAPGEAAAPSEARQELSDREMMRFIQYLEAPRLVRGGRVQARWYEDGNTFWFEDHEGRHFVDPGQKALEPLTPEKQRSWKAEEPRERAGRIYSQDRERYVTVDGGDLWLFDAGSEEGWRLTEDAGKDIFWRMSPEGWSPDGARLFALRADLRRVHHLPIIDYTHAEETVREVVYGKTGGGFMRFEFAVFAPGEGKKVVLDTGLEEDIYLFPIGWREDGGEVLFLRMTREAKRLDLMAADPGTGKSRVVLTETRETFVGGLDFITGGWREFYTPLEGRDEFLWLSERDDWRHIYHYDLEGRLIRRLTEGSFPVLRVAAVDTGRNLMFFLANAEDRLYDTHLYRVGLDGGGFRRLTEGIGEHDVQFAPSKRCFVDTHSSNGRPPVSELRDADGKLMLVLSRADTSRLEAMGWTPPEEFVVKADDGVTDLHGVLYKPADLDPLMRYPVIDFIYSGPFITMVPNTYAPSSPLARRAHAMAQMGFITFIVDCRGTVERGKAFQDASFGRIGQIEIPDHVATLRRLAAERPYMDMERVGIFGASWGGYFTLRGMLTAPEVFHVGVAVAPGDLTEAQAINEPYMGLPQNNPEGYAAGSNPGMATALKGKLLIIHGTADVNAPVSTTMRMTDALIRAGKIHDLAIMPQADHFFQGASGRYLGELVISYFKEHLDKD